jgi:hypothetical protein
MAQQKMSQAEAAYQDRPKSGLTCAAYTLFRPPRSCEVVQGDISPNGWCKFFDLPDCPAGSFFPENREEALPLPESGLQAFEICCKSIV